MIFDLENENKGIPDIESLIGKQLDLPSKLKEKKYGSNLYNLRKLNFKENRIGIALKENSRCNFEKFENGILLRINDNQKLFGLALSNESVNEIVIQKGSVKIVPISLAGLLNWIGVKKDTIEKYRFLIGGFYTERFRLEIKTNWGHLCLDSNPGNYTIEKEYFLDSVLKAKLKIRE
jgi:hypothetical protein